MELLLLLKITLIIVVIILAVYILLPCREYFESTVDMLNKKSSVIYSNDKLKTDQDYFDSLNTFDTNNNLLMIMYRCIEFKKGGIEKVIHKLKFKNKFFISKKYEINYTDFSSIKEHIKTSILKLYDDSKQKMIGPIYLLITQYPLYNTVSSDCRITTQSSPLENSYSPMVNTIDENCKAHPEKLIKCEFYILMPSHKSDNGKVGSPNKASWGSITENMKDLLVKNENINNVRSQDKPCFTKCGKIQVDGYICGARNSVTDTPYKSVVFNTPTNNNVSQNQSDYANLYIFNTSGINNLLGMTLESTRIIEEGVKTQAVALPPKAKRDSIFGGDLSNINDNDNNNPCIDKYAYDLQQQKIANEKQLSDKIKILAKANSRTKNVSRSSSRSRKNAKANSSTRNVSRSSSRSRKNAKANSRTKNVSRSSLRSRNMSITSSFLSNNPASKKKAAKNNVRKR